MSYENDFKISRDLIEFVESKHYLLIENMIIIEIIFDPNINNDIIIGSNCSVSVGLINSEQKMPSGPKHRPSLQKGFQITSGCLEDSRNHNLIEFKLLYFKPNKIIL